MTLDDALPASPTTDAPAPAVPAIDSTPRLTRSEQVASLLGKARAAHARYHEAHRLGRQRSDWAKSRQALAACREARECRARAHALDPAHETGAWSGDAVPGDHNTATHDELHDELMQFYDKQIARYDAEMTRGD